MLAPAFCTSVGLGHRPGARGGGVVVQRRPRFRACAAPAVLSVRDVVDAAKRQGLELRNDCSGPVIKLDLFKEGRLTAYITGIVLPQNRLHIEAYKAKKKEGGALLSVSPGMLVFMGALAFGADKGCTEVYGLAINDEAKQHARLRRYLRRFGGQEVKKVTRRMFDIPNLLLYGGEGMIVKGDVATMLRRSRDMLDREAAVSPVA